MPKMQAIAGAVAIVIGSAAWAFAGPWEDGLIAYNRGDYVPAVKLFRPLAQAGNVKAQSVLGTMYSRGEGIERSTSRAFVWFSLAARKGDSRAKAGLKEVSAQMSPAELAHAKGMMAACEASGYRDCAY